MYLKEQFLLICWTGVFSLAYFGVVMADIIFYIERDSQEQKCSAT